MEVRKDIFISYRNDGTGNNFATRLANDLKQSGYSVYFNPDEVRSGDFPERLKTAINNCKDFLCIVTEGYICQLQENKEVCWVRDELLCAKNYNKNIIPILVNGASMPSDIMTMPENLRFFPKIDACVFPEQYIRSPYSVLCSEVLLSKNDGKNGFRDVYSSSELFDPDKSLSDILTQAENGDVRAMLTAGIYYYHGVSGGKDDRKAAYWLKKVSTTDGEYAAIADKFIARMYYDGVMPREPQSYEKSYEYFLKSSKADMYSAGQAGMMQTIGSGCEFNYSQTEHYYSSLIESLDAPRKAVLCKFYIEHGEFQKAATIYESMVVTYPSAAYELGLMYKRGVLNDPFMPDYSKAEKYFKKALDNGYVQAALEIGHLYFNPTGAFEKNFIIAQKYYSIAAENGSPDAQYFLGFMYQNGHVKKDITQAIKLYEEAARQGHVFSAAHLALLYQIPEFHNYEKAFKYCKYAADCGDTPSEFVLGTMYLSGRGCEPDEDKAYLCFKHAAENGAPEAIVMLQQMDELGI